MLEYLQAHDWQQDRPIGFGRFFGLCPQHTDHEPSFLVDPCKNLFHCYGCRRGGDIIRFVELYHQVKFPETVALLQQWRGLPPLLDEAAGFYRMQLHRHPNAVAWADTTLRTYVHELLHFLRWWEGVHHTDAVAKDFLTETTLLDYVRFQSGQERELTGATGKS